MTTYDLDFSLSDLEKAIANEQAKTGYSRFYEDEDEVTDDRHYVDWNSFDWEWRNDTWLDGIGYVSKEYSHGGGEGDGEERWVVVRVENSDGKRYFRIDGYYMSYDGSHFDGELYEAEIVKREVKFYEPKKG